MPYGVKANIKAPHRFLRIGALCWVCNPNAGWGGEKIKVTGMTRGGRRVHTWIDARDLANFRQGWFDNASAMHLYTLDFCSPEAAHEWAKSMNERFGNKPVRPHALKFAKGGFLSEAAKFVDSVNPLSGPNLMRRATSMDNGDGTLTFHRHLPFGDK